MAFSSLPPPQYTRLAKWATGLLAGIGARNCMRDRRRPKAKWRTTQLQHE
jgi:hypothetical protein